MGILSNVFQEAQTICTRLCLRGVVPDGQLEMLVGWLLRNIEASRFNNFHFKDQEHIKKYHGPLWFEGEMIDAVLANVRGLAQLDYVVTESHEVLAASFLAMNLFSLGEPDLGIGVGEFRDFLPESLDGLSISQSVQKNVAWIALATLTNYSPITIDCNPLGAVTLEVQNLGKAGFEPDSPRTLNNFPWTRIHEIGQAGRYRANNGSLFSAATVADNQLHYPLNFRGSLANWNTFVSRIEKKAKPGEVGRDWLTVEPVDTGVQVDVRRAKGAL